MCSSSNSADQLTLDLFDEPPLPTPDACPFELYLLDYGQKLKSKCGFRGSVIWTNCRDAGHCLWDGWHQQGTSNGLTTGGEDDDDDC
nr:MAG TPA: hypothetical protein [Caudoviricetes sp.]